MINKKKILGIVPARIGSKGLKFKNLRKVNNKPLVYWPIKALKKSKYIDKIIVSTDSNKIRKLSKSYGAEVPFIRPKNLSMDKSKSSDVVIHALKFLSKRGIDFDFFIMLEPTSPLTTFKDVDNAIEKFYKNSKKYDSAISVAENISGHPNFCIKIKKNNTIKPFLKKFETNRRQSLRKLYFYSGNFYISKIVSFLKKKTFYHKKSLPIISGKIKAFEIDDQVDLEIVDFIMKKKIE